MGKMVRNIFVTVSDFLQIDTTLLTNTSSQGRARDFHEALWYHFFE
jgi:hypothetical protein